LPFTWTSNAAIDSRFIVITGRDQPVLYRAAFEFAELPGENVALKWLHCFRIIGVNLEVSNAIHLLLLLFVRR
jgi:hypothetical protein